MAGGPYFFRDKGGLLRIIPEDVLYIEVVNNYIEFFTETKRGMIVRTSLDAALKYLPEGMFLKTHRSYAAGVNHIYSISKEIVTFFPSPEDFQIPMSKQYYSAFIKQIRIIESARTPDPKHKKN